ncbi:MAG: DUF362 domain-containing protein [Deltaproteobacteria bacterium]|nr:DUF362 domain-containing protein [Deltaproteobacteria bacterium]
MNKAKVSIVKTGKNPDYAAVMAAVREAVELVGGIEDIIKPGQLVMVKPNLAANPGAKESGVCTWPEVSRAVADLVKELGARPVIAESSAAGVKTEEVMEEAGYLALRDMGYEVVNLDKAPLAEISVPGGSGIFEPMLTYELALQVDVIISLPTLKCHDQTEITCAMKNLKGLLPDKMKKKFHQEGLFEGVCDLMLALKPRLTVVDAIICQEGVGPIFGDPVEMDLILAGKDLVAVDAVSGRLIGYEPEEVMLTTMGAKAGLGVMEADQIEVVGEVLESVRRRFVRSSEVDLTAEIDDFEMIYGQATCTGCRNTALSALIDMKNADQFKYLPGITVIIGDVDVPAGTKTDNLVTVGRCVPKERRMGRHVKGCPPENVEIVRGILGDKAETDRMY